MKYSRMGLLFLGACLVSGCVKVSTGAEFPTLGEQIVELSRAKELGALTDKEYRALRRKVLASF